LDNGQPHTSILHGLTPLHTACSGGSEAVVRLLLSYGADVNATRTKIPKGSGMGLITGTEGSTPLHFAAANGHLEVVRLLLEKGAHPTAKDKDGLTPESLAASQGHATCVTLLRLWITSYGRNGLAGLVPPEAKSASLTAPCPSSDYGLLAVGALRGQRSFEQLTSAAAAGVKVSLKSHKKQELAKMSSNPNLKASSSTSSLLTTPPLPSPLPLPTGRSDFGSISSTGTITSHTVSPSASSSSLAPVQVRESKESKRRPSLPSIFEKSSHYSQGMAVPVRVTATDILEELTIVEQRKERSKSNASLPPSPIRLTHRLIGKRSQLGAGPTAQEQAQAILRTAEGDCQPTSKDGSAMTLTQMLASYGEALAQERKGGGVPSPSLKLRKQSSVASLSGGRNHLLPSVTEHIPISPGMDPFSTTTSPGRLNRQDSLTPISTPPDSPLMTRSRTESLATSSSRSTSFNRQNGPPLRDSKETLTGRFNL
jgi:hypothetical protein